MVPRLAASVMKTVQGVVQVVGLHNIPATPRDAPALRQWYFEVGRNDIFIQLPDADSS